MASVKIRAHRILNRLGSYRRAEEATPNDLACVRGLEMNPREQYIGVYENAPSPFRGSVVVTDRAIYIADAHTRRCLPYEEMESVSVVGEKHAADRLMIRLRDGRTYEVPITGGRGRLRDVWAFLRFLNRVIADREYQPAGDGR